MQAPPKKDDNGKEIQRFYDPWNQQIRASKAFDAYDINTFLTAISEQKLGEATKLKWMEHSSMNPRQRFPIWIFYIFWTCRPNTLNLLLSSGNNRRPRISPTLQLRKHAYYAESETIHYAVVENSKARHARSVGI